MKTEAQLKDRYEKLKWVTSEEFDGYIPRIKLIDLKREMYFLEEILK